MTWLSILTALLKVAGSLTTYLQQRQLIEAGQAEIIKQNLEFSLDLVTKSTNAKNAAIARFDANGGVPDANDPNLRD